MNKENARVDCLASELYIEGFFGNITQGVNGQVSDLHDYIYQKRKVEISSLLRNTKKPFVFRPNKQNYTHNSKNVASQHGTLSVF